MDERQFREKYGVDTFLELTHIHVTDPIEDLTVVARFPDGFGSSPDFDLQNSLYPRVTHLDVDTADLQNINTKHNGKLEAELTQAGALRYIESLNIASLRVHRPVIGYSYGIVWRVPPVNGDEHAADEILDLLRQVKSSSPCRSFLKKLFVGFIAIVRKELIPAPAVELELSLMVYDPSQPVSYTHLARNMPAPPDGFPPSAFSARLGETPDARSAGIKPKANTVPTAQTTAKPNTRQPTPTSRYAGKPDGPSCATTSGAALAANSRPSVHEMPARSPLSMRSCCTRRPRPAPMAMRRAISLSLIHI